MKKNDRQSEPAFILPCSMMGASLSHLFLDDDAPQDELGLASAPAPAPAPAD